LTDTSETQPLDLVGRFVRDGSENSSPPMLMFRFRSGDSTALPYSMLSQIDYNPSGELKLNFSAVFVTIKGSKLGELHQGITEHRLAQVQEATKRQLLFSSAQEDYDAPSIETITIE